MPAVSVIISVYNVEPYMARCARSLFGQTLRDMEFVFVDDCTPDRSVEVMKEVLEEFPDRKSQVKVFRMPQNSGQALVRMKGLELATGDYLAHCDADDWVEADAYEKAYGKALSGGFDIVTFDFRKGSDGNWVSCSSGSVPGKELSDIMTGTVMGSLWCRLFKRSLADGLALPAGNMAEDMALSIQMTAKAGRIGHLDDVLYSYFVRPDSISHSAGMEAALARQESMYANTRLCAGLLQPYADKFGAADMLIFKYRSRHYLEPYVHHKEVYRKWRSTFPEIDRELLAARGIPPETKFWYVLIRLHLYHLWKVLSGKHSLI